MTEIALLIALAVIALLFIFIPLALFGTTVWATFSITRLWREARKQSKAARGVNWTEIDRGLCEQATRRPCPKCGGELTWEDSSSGPYVFCVSCGYGGQD